MTTPSTTHEAPDEPVPDDPAGDETEPAYIPLAVAAQRYKVSTATLAHLLRCGTLAGHKVRGPRGHEWRVQVAALHTAGYAPRDDPAADTAPAAHADPVREELRLHRLLTYERRRGDDLEGRLGAALMEIGRLRAQLAQAASAETPRPHNTFAERGLVILNAPEAVDSPG